MLTRLSPHRADAAHGDGVQHGRNGAHIVVAEQQPKQAGKGIHLPMGAA